MEWRESSVSPSRRALVREHHNCRLQHFTWEKVLVSSQHTQCSFCTQSHTDAVADTHTHTHRIMSQSWWHLALSRPCRSCFEDTGCWLETGSWCFPQKFQRAVTANFSSNIRSFTAVSPLPPSPSFKILRKLLQSTSVCSVVWEGANYASGYNKHTFTYTNLCVCVCVCVKAEARNNDSSIVIYL